MKHLLVALVLLASISASCADDAELLKLSDELSALQPFVGNWEINATWESGDKLWARNEYKVELGGKFLVAKTFAKDGDRDPYERYRTIFAWDKKAKKVQAHGFTFDGTTTVTEMKLSKTDDGHVQVESSWKPNDGSVTIRQQLTVVSKKEIKWQVWSRPDEGEETVMMNGTWKKVEE